MRAIRFPLAFGSDDSVERTDEESDQDTHADEPQPDEDFDASEEWRFERAEDAAYYRERGG